MKKVFFIAMLSAAVIFAENTDSLKAELQKIEAELLKAEIERKSEMLRQIREGGQIDQTNAQNEEPLTEGETATEIRNGSSERKNVSLKIKNEDTDISIVRVKTVSKDGGMVTDTTIRTISFFPKMFSGRNYESDKWKANDYIGIGGGSSVGITYLDTKEAKQFLKGLENTNPSLRVYGISNKIDEREPAFTVGGFGHGNIGNGMIIGGGGYFTLVERVSKQKDSLCEAQFSLSYGGVLIGGGWYKGENSFQITSLIGGGMYQIEMDVDERQQVNYNNQSNYYNYDNDHDYDYSARVFSVELSAAYTRSVLRWLHIGAEISSLFTYSNRGFDYEGSFTTVNPSAKIKFIFGSI